MRVIKWFFILSFIVVIGIPSAVIGAALIKDEKPPAYLSEVDLNEFDGEEAILAELDKFIIQFISGDQSITLDEKTVNKLIYANYHGFKDDKTKIVVNDDIVIHIEGFWTDFENDELTLYTILRNGKVSTSLTLKAKITTSEDSLSIEFERFKIGKLPIPNSVFVTLLDNYGSSITSEYEYGTIDTEKLIITVDKEYIQDELEKAMNSNLILFDSLVFQKNQLVINCDLNAEINPDAAVLLETIDEIKRIVNDDSLLNNVKNRLDDDDLTADEKNKVDDFIDELTEFNEIIKSKIENPTGVSADDLETINGLQDKFNDIPESSKQEVVLALEESIDPNIKEQLLETLESLGISGFENVSDLIFGTGSSK